MERQNHQPTQQKHCRCQNIGRLKALSVAHIVLGILAILFQIGAIINKSGVNFTLAGVWAGSFFIATGAVCLVSWIFKREWTVITFVVMSTISFVVTGVVILMTVLSLVRTTSCCKNCHYRSHQLHPCGNQPDASLPLDVFLMIVTVLESCVTIASIGFGFQSHRSSKVQTRAENIQIEPTEQGSNIQSGNTGNQRRRSYQQLENDGQRQIHRYQQLNPGQGGMIRNNQDRSQTNGGNVNEGSQDVTTNDNDSINTISQDVDRSDDNHINESSQDVNSDDDNSMNENSPDVNRDDAEEGY